SFVVKRGVPLDRPERQRAVHRPALQVHIAEFARQTGSDRALARSGWAVYGDDEFALGRIGHWGNVRFYTAHAWKTTGAWRLRSSSAWPLSPPPKSAAELRSAWTGEGSRPYTTRSGRRVLGAWAFFCGGSSSSDLLPT